MTAALTAFRTLIATTPTWRDLCGVADTVPAPSEAVTAALAHIIDWGEDGDDLDADNLPRLYIHQPAQSSRLIADAERSRAGSFSFDIYLARDTSGTPKSTYRTVAAQILDDLMHDLESLTAGAGYIQLDEITINAPSPEKRSRTNPDGFWKFTGTAAYRLE